MPQEGGAFGLIHRGSVTLRNRLLRSALPPPHGDFQLLPQPRGALSDLKPAPLPAGSLQPGTIKVSLGALSQGTRLLLRDWPPSMT